MKRATFAAALTAIAGAGLTAYSLTRDPGAADVSVLLGFTYATSLAMGALLLTAVFNATGAVWPTLLRRQLEHHASALLPGAAAFVLVAARLDRVYGWASA